MRNSRKTFLGFLFAGLILAGCGNQACEGTMEASEPVIIRPEDVGGSDRCDTCRLAFYPEAASTSAGILVVWALGFEGQQPEPNAYMRLLDDNAHPLGEGNVLFERNMIGESRLVSVKDGAALAFCGRFDYEDRMTSVILDPAGRIMSEQRRSPDEASCGWGPEAVWTGSRLMFGWIDRRFDPEADYNMREQVVVDIAGAEGNSLSWRAIEPSDGEDARFAVGHGRVLLVANLWTGPGRTRLAVHRLDLEGNELGEPVFIDPVGSDVGGERAGGFKTPFIVPTREGWILLAASWPSSGRYVAHLAPDGSVISGPDLVDPNDDFAWGFEDVIPFGGGAAILAELSSGEERIIFLSAEGTVRQVWDVSQDEVWGDGDLIEHRGHLFWIYATRPAPENPTTNQVRAREFQCVP